MCYVSDGKSLGPANRVGNVIARIQNALAVQADWIQIREKDLAARELLALTRGALVAATGRDPAARVMVNERLDIALAAGAAGVHFGAESLPACDVVHWLRGAQTPADFRVGVSCHSVDQAIQAQEDGASYIFFGPVFDTPAKRVFGAPQGIPSLRKVCRAVRIPVIAIGGVSGDNGADCISAGAAGIAAIRWFQETDDTAALRQAIDRLHGSQP